MDERERKSERIKAYDRTDLAFKIYYDESIAYIKQFPNGKICKNINDVLEEYNIVKIIERAEIKTADLDNIESWIQKIKSACFRYFKEIHDSNIIEEYSRVNCLYFDDFWEMFEKGRVYEQISSDLIERILTMENGNALFYILQNRKIVEKYNVQLREYMLAHPKSAEILIKKFIEKSDSFQPIFYIPSTLKTNEYELILQKYIESETVKWNYLDVLSKAKSTREFPVSDRFKYKCKKRMEELGKTIFKKDQEIISSITVEIKPLTSICATDLDNPLDVKIGYDSNWLNKFTDFSTILNNFIHVFEVTDYMGRLDFVKQKCDEGSLSYFIGVHGKYEYRMEPSQQHRLTKSLISLQAYYNFLKQRGINLIDVFVWFFENYLPNEFNVTGFTFNVSVEGKSILELIKLMFIELDEILRKYCLYVTDGFINQELFEISSSPITIGQIPSILEKKYLYIKSEDLKNMLFWIFSASSGLTSIARDTPKGNNFIHENNFYSLVRKNPIYYNDFFQRPRAIVNVLKDKGVLQIEDDGKISLNEMKCQVLKQLYEYRVLNFYCLKKDTRIKAYIEELLQNGELEYKDTLFSEPEADFFNYILNKSKYSDGLDLRNRYIHGSYSKDERKQEWDYLIVLLVVVSVILKINEEFCLKYPKENSIEWC